MVIPLLSANMWLVSRRPVTHKLMSEMEQVIFVVLITIRIM